MLKWYLDKDWSMFKFEFQIRRNKLLKIGITWHKNECLPTILIQTNPYIVSTNLSMISLFYETFLRPLHDMPISVERFKSLDKQWQVNGQYELL